jgi:hypothetical protein
VLEYGRFALFVLKIMIENAELFFQWQFAQTDLAEEIEGRIQNHR